MHKHIRRSAWGLLLTHGICNLPVNINDLLCNMGVRCYDYRSGWPIIDQLGLDGLCKNEAFTVQVDDGKYIIFYHPEPFKSRLKFTLAHEIGHIVLGHPLTDYPRCRAFAINSANDPTERQANRFAARLLAPACVLHEIGVITAHEIMDHTGMSYYAAKVRLDEIQRLNRLGMYYSDPMEVAVREQFWGYIQRHSRSFRGSVD